MKGYRYDEMLRDRLFHNVDRQRHGTQLKKKETFEVSQFSNYLFVFKNILRYSGTTIN